MLFELDVQRVRAVAQLRLGDAKRVRDFQSVGVNKVWYLMAQRLQQYRHVKVSIMRKNRRVRREHAGDLLP